MYRGFPNPPPWGPIKSNIKDCSGEAIGSVKIAPGEVFGPSLFFLCQLSNVVTHVSRKS